MFKTGVNPYLYDLCATENTNQNVFINWDLWASLQPSNQHLFQTSFTLRTTRERENYWARKWSGEDRRWLVIHQYGNGALQQWLSETCSYNQIIVVAVHHCHTGIWCTACNNDCKAGKRYQRDGKEEEVQRPQGGVQSRKVGKIGSNSELKRVEMLCGGLFATTLIQ